VRNARGLAAEMVRRGFNLVSGGTDNHLFLVDLRENGLTGLEAEQALERGGISVNKNAVPFDAQSMAVTSGIRIGTPAVTTRGMREEEMRRIAAWIAQVLESPRDADRLQGIRKEVEKLCRTFPVYPPSWSQAALRSAGRG
jgi:glycine hydroxymethyltransferase